MWPRVATQWSTGSKEELVLVGSHLDAFSGYRPYLYPATSPPVVCSSRPLVLGTTFNSSTPMADRDRLSTTF